jgi:hypothetical protein
MAAAVRIGEEFLIPQALTAFAAMGADPMLAMAKRLLAWIARAEVTEFSLRDAHQDLREHQATVGMVLEAADLLVEHGYLRPVPEAPEEPGRKGGRSPSPRFAVNPLWRPQKDHFPQNPDDDADSGGFEESEANEDGPSPGDDPGSTQGFEECEENEEGEEDRAPTGSEYDEEVF